MATFERFKFKSVDEIREKVKELGVNINFSDDLSPLANPVKIGHVESPNSIAVLPMEGCDSERDGSPSGSREETLSSVCCRRSRPFVV